MAKKQGPAEQTPTKWNFFGPPPLLEGEDSAAYDGLLARVSGAVEPTDIIEEIWIRDIVDLEWEVQRLRRLKAQLITVTAHKGLKQILLDLKLTDYNTASALSVAWAQCDSDSIKEVEELLASAELTMDTVMAQTLALKLDQVDRIDRMLMSAEARRNSVLREIDRHRASVAQALRQAVKDIEDAQFEEVEAKKIADQKAA